MRFARVAVALALGTAAVALGVVVRNTVSSTFESNDDGGVRRSRRRLQATSTYQQQSSGSDQVDILSALRQKRGYDTGPSGYSQTAPMQQEPPQQQLYVPEQEMGPRDAYQQLTPNDATMPYGQQQQAGQDQQQQQQQQYQPGTVFGSGSDTQHPPPSSIEVQEYGSTQQASPYVQPPPQQASQVDVYTPPQTSHSMQQETTRSSPGADFGSYGEQQPPPLAATLYQPDPMPQQQFNVQQQASPYGMEVAPAQGQQQQDPEPSTLGEADNVQEEPSSTTVYGNGVDTRHGSACNVHAPDEVAVEHPTWTASYPGSGAKLTWKLIRAVTGIWTSDDHDHNGRVTNGVVAAIKTHYPSHTPQEVFDNPKLEHIDQAILLLRHPLTSIPSYHNFLYERENGLRNHSTRAPIEVWLKWRNQYFREEVQAWVDHAQYWIDNYHHGPKTSKLHILPFEHLTAKDNPKLGKMTLTLLAGFLASIDNGIAKHMVGLDDIDCIWTQYVTGHPEGETARRHSHREGGPTEYPYTVQQMEEMLDALAQLRDRNVSIVAFADLLWEYMDMLQQKIRQVQQQVDAY